MATFGEIQTKVSTRLKDPNNTSVSAPDVASVINDAIQDWATRRFWFNEFEETVQLVQNDPILPALPNGIVPLYLFKKDGIVINYANTRWLVKKISAAEYDGMNVQGRGIPFAYTYRNGQYELYWYPDATYSAVIRGIKAYDRFREDGSDDSQTNDFLTDAPDLIMYEALSRLYGEFRQDPKMETYYAARTQNEYQNALRQTRRLNGTGRIQVEGF